MTRATAAATPMPTAMPVHGEVPPPRNRMVKPYAPMPTNALWPSEICPALAIRFHATPASAQTTESVSTRT